MFERFRNPSTARGLPDPGGGTLRPAEDKDSDAGGRRKVDRVTPSQGAQALFHKLPSGPNKRLVEIGEGTHFVMVEKNRMQLFQDVQFFLDWAGRN
jgi:hypothetical protein